MIDVFFSRKNWHTILIPDYFIITYNNIVILFYCGKFIGFFFHDGFILTFPILNILELTCKTFPRLLKSAPVGNSFHPFISIYQTEQQG